jgi:hypothetical protein
VFFCEERERSGVVKEDPPPSKKPSLIGRGGDNDVSLSKFVKQQQGNEESHKKVSGGLDKVTSLRKDRNMM